MNLYQVIKSILLAGDEVISPLYEGITVVGPYALGTVAILSVFYGIFLGVKYAKCESADEKANLQKVMVNFWIGAITIIILISVVYAIRGPLARFIDS